MNSRVYLVLAGADAGVRCGMKMINQQFVDVGTGTTWCTFKIAYNMMCCFNCFDTKYGQLHKFYCCIFQNKVLYCLLCNLYIMMGQMSMAEV